MRSRPKLSLRARLLWIICRGVALMPHWLQYGVVAKVIYFLLRYVVRYRRKLIVRQLTESFPEQTVRQIATMCNEYYHTLAENFVGTMSLASMNYRHRLEVLDVQVSEDIKAMVNGRHAVVLSSHHNLWEYAQFVGLKFEGYLTICAYHPLTNKVWDELLYHLRYSRDALPVASSSLIRYFLEHRASGVDGRQMLLGLIADQNSAPKGDVHWYDFLNHKSLFFEGGEQLALKYHLPVLYLSMSRIVAGRYKCEVKVIYDGNEAVAQHEITERYVRELERDIRREPAGWMWSHRRWKYYPDPETGQVKYCNRYE